MPMKTKREKQIKRELIFQDNYFKNYELIFHVMN